MENHTFFHGKYIKYIFKLVVFVIVMLVFGHVIVDDFLWGPTYNLSQFSGCFAEGEGEKTGGMRENASVGWFYWAGKVLEP